MKIIVGLGNPGKEYEKTRHNVGFEVLDLLYERLVKAGLATGSNMPNFTIERKFNAQMAQFKTVILVKPQTFMNQSGAAVVKIVRFYRVLLNDLWVVHDDLDIKLGEYKIQMGKGPKVHNGLMSIEQALGNSDYWRVRVGTENRNQEERLLMTGENYVLKPFLKDEEPMMNQVRERVADELISKYL